jgi:uncharacterized membrane protein (UPF0127 family)
MKSGRGLVSIALLTLFSGCGAASQPGNVQGSHISTQTGLTTVQLQIEGPSGKHSFRVEIARTEDQQAKGLMFVESLRPDEGMIFVFPTLRPASFWMKNTLIPLDMIFVRDDCSIARIAVNTVPESLDPVGTEEPVRAVLEIAGGRAVELGISEGDCVTWPGGPARKA